MDNLTLAINVVFPMFFMMVAGYIMRIKNLVDNHSLNIMNKLIFRVFMSILLFLNIYKMDIKEALSKENIFLILMLYTIIIAAFLIFIFTLPKFIKDKKKCSVMIQGLVRGNSILFGIPIVASIYGDDRIGLVSLLAAYLIPLFNVLGVTVLEIYRGGKVNIKKVLLGIVKNPTIVASALAFLFIFIGVKIPNLILSPLESMSKVTTPLAFIVLGGTFDFKALCNNAKYLTVVALGKLIVIPAIVFYIAYSIGIGNGEMVALLGVMTSPVAIASFSMAKEMDADGELAGQIVITTSIASIATIFFWVYLFGTLNII
ncbi:MAG TPA: AEC family transporter [Patescibacteria group bacterium]|jgi:predicted permease|nr:family transporter [Clostridia bacterium]HYE11058.1 AEC family transporter [Patescibacteria group bacterium]